MLTFFACKQNINYYCQYFISLLETNFFKLFLFDVSEKIARSDSDIVDFDIFAVSRFEI